ncbi:hypothetical protein [Sphingorhabdus sp.]|uniref:hypothetical protein n=1 Tax=Sphingorhabdus sp. TaxID=1902408 RepID=UPI0032B880A9
MTEPAFPQHISAALDRLTVPPVPTGFGERLAARIAAGDLPADNAAITPQIPSARRRFGSTSWRRSGRVVTVVAAFGIATATAAASGFFGEPVYVPVVSDALAKAKLVELPARTAKPAPKAVAVSEVDTKAAEVPKATGREAVRSLYDRLRADPEYRTLPRRERVAIARQEIRTLLQSGEVTLPELRQALTEHHTEIRPALKQRIERQIVRRELRERTAGPVSLQPRDAEVPSALPQRQIDPAKIEAAREAYQQLPADQKAKLAELRQQLRTAPFAERRAIRQEIRAILQSTGQTTEEKFEPANEGNSEVVR